MTKSEPETETEPKDKGQNPPKPIDDGLSASVGHLLHRALSISHALFLEETQGQMTQRQYAVLQVLLTRNGISQNDLVQITGIDRSTLAELVGRMVSLGWISRTRLETDKRTNCVFLSDEGRALLQAQIKNVRRADQRLLALLSEPKRDGFHKALLKLVAHADDPEWQAQQQAQQLAHQSGKKDKKKDKPKYKSAYLFPEADKV